MPLLLRLFIIFPLAVIVLTASLIEAAFHIIGDGLDRLIRWIGKDD